jgi:small subunit ribosomal protein S1
MANDFASMFEQSSGAQVRKAARLSPGDKVEGTVLEISGGLVILDIGGSADATMDLLEFEERPIKVGDKVRATVENPRTDGPVLTLALGKGGSGINTETLTRAMEGGTPVSGTVTASNKGGFTVEVSGVRAFCPISQIDSSYVNEPEIFVGQTFDFLVTEVREGGRNVVLSRRKLLDDERRHNEEALVAALSVGAIVSGSVKKTVRQGAVIDLGGAEGFIPISEISHARIDTPEDVVSIGETVETKVISIETTDKGLSIRLSLKALSSAPKAEEVGKDEILTGKVIKHVPHGLIVQTPKGEGLVPTRELSLAPGADHRRSYPVDMELQVVVVHRDATSGKLRFSVDKVAQVEERNNFRQFGGGGKNSKDTTLGSLGDVMMKKMSALSAKAAKNPVPPHVKEQARQAQAAKQKPAAEAAPSEAQSASPGAAPVAATTPQSTKQDGPGGAKKRSDVPGVVRRSR